MWFELHAPAGLFLTCPYSQGADKGKDTCSDLGPRSSPVGLKWMNAFSWEEPSSVATAVPLKVESTLDELREVMGGFQKAVGSVLSALAPELVSGDNGLLISLSLKLMSAEATQT